MSTISLTSAKPAAGGLGKMFARIGQAWADRRAAASLAGMSERELQDVGWGQTDRYSQAASLGETPLERRARAAAVAAWHGSTRKAA
jgi:hypothetical protein